MAGTGLGLSLAVGGTFGSWVVSGGVERNSYAIVGIIDRLGVLGDGFGAHALSWWPLLGPLAIVPVIAGILRWWRTASVLSLLFGVLIGVIGAGVLAVASGHRTAGIALDPSGPVVTVIGAVLVLCGSIPHLVLERRRRRLPPIHPFHVSAEPFADSSRRTHQPDSYEAHRYQ
ncbi:hypothetical protein SAMN04515671_4070 [Nakamurella panacisegetis]|uniref:Uncharacterized protein n=1 Tax=Nakamurella panacisegetis TaxID=1090615 RepID=A0A1H0SFN7_9ACTN|nr:hypothetical protein [Nakamurella panacisegetis]SDP40329.1 hypothetical protein SAMN04515671_4070 [Nakamurella panacisegetis]